VHSSNISRIEPPESQQVGNVYSKDVEFLRVHNRDIVLVGTAHISAESVALVHEVIQQERPDVVCIELDDRRHRALVEKSRWEGLDLRQVIRDRQLATLFLNFLLSSYQKRLGGKLGVVPGSELLEAAETAQSLNIPVVLCDRDIRITLRRAWGALSMMDKAKLVGSALLGLTEEQQLDEEELRRIRSRDVLSELMNELGRVMPALRRVLIDERDAYLAEKIRQSPGQKVVVVVGAGHVAGMRLALTGDLPVDMQEITRIPDMPMLFKLLGWGLPALLLAAIGVIGMTKGAAAAAHNMEYWVLANGIPAALGSLLAFAHPLTILAAFIAAPFTSLIPLVGVGHVSAFVQAYAYPPRVHEFSSVSEDITVVKLWWQSRLLRVLLVFILSSIGGLIGVWIGGAKVVSSLM
jgi:pheromone shutdown-related protein TraB